MSTLANASWMSKSSCLVTRFLIFFFLCINVHLFSLNQIIHYKIYWKGRHYPTTRICSKCNLAPVKCDLPWMLHVLFRGFMCIVIHKWDCVCPWTWSLYYVWCNKSVVLWRSSFHVKMESMNKLGEWNTPSRNSCRCQTLDVSVVLARLCNIQIQLHYEFSAQRSGNMG